MISAMRQPRRAATGVVVFGLLAALAACGGEAGRDVDLGGFGNATAQNTQSQMGEGTGTQMLATRFSREVPDTINFDFGSATLTPAAMATLDRQAGWIRQFPELKFRVYGHTDLVGSNAANKALGQARAQAVVAYFATRGISPARLEALVSYGETRPLVRTNAPEERNRRTVTEVGGFTQAARATLNGKYAIVVFRAYTGATAPAAAATGSGG